MTLDLILRILEAATKYTLVYTIRPGNYVCPQTTIEWKIVPIKEKE